jgi:cation diffusion facilitator CzcD-associated flavoprotein CzcO
MDFRELFYAAITDNDSDFAKMIRDGCTNMIKTQLPEQPELWEKLTPNYAPGCKRVIISDDYYPALARANVDLETRPITRITQKGIEVGAEDSQQYDLIVLATGFRTVEFMYPMEIYGKNGRLLGDIWKNGAMAYKGVTVEDLPNFGMFYGPNTNLGMRHLFVSG